MTLRTTKLRLARAVEQGQRKAARDLAKTLPDVIRERVRSGIGLTGTFKALSDSYIKFRRRARKRLSSDTTPETSNLTATGQMLKAIVGEATGTVVRIFIKGNRRRELGGGPSKSNNEIRGYVEKERPFFELTKNERALAEKTAAEIIKEEIKRVLK